MRNKNNCEFFNKKEQNNSNYYRIFSWQNSNSTIYVGASYLNIELYTMRIVDSVAHGLYNIVFGYDMIITQFIFGEYCPIFFIDEVA